MPSGVVVSSSLDRDQIDLGTKTIYLRLQIGKVFFVTISCRSAQNTSEQGIKTYTLSARKVRLVIWWPHVAYQKHTILWSLLPRLATVVFVTAAAALGLGLLLLLASTLAADLCAATALSGGGRTADDLGPRVVAPLALGALLHAHAVRAVKRKQNLGKHFQ